MPGSGVGWGAGGHLATAGAVRKGRPRAPKAVRGRWERRTDGAEAAKEDTEGRGRGHGPWTTSRRTASWPLALPLRSAPKGQGHLGSPWPQPRASHGLGTHRDPVGQPSSAPVPMAQLTPAHPGSLPTLPTGMRPALLSVQCLVSVVYPQMMPGIFCTQPSRTPLYTWSAACGPGLPRTKGTWRYQSKCSEGPRR